MRTLGNILWHFPFLGFINAFLTFVIGLLLTVIVIPAPLGLGLMELGRFYLAPFTRRMVRDSDLDPHAKFGMWNAYPWLVMILWFPFGLVLAVGAVVQVFFLCLSIVGIPVAIVVAKSIGTIFNPVGKRCVSAAVADELERRAAIRELDGPHGQDVRVEPTLTKEVSGVAPETVVRAQADDRAPASVQGGDRPRLTKGLKIGLVVGIPLVLAVIFGFRMLGSSGGSQPVRVPTVTAQAPAAKQPKPVPAAVTPLPSPPAPSHSGIPEIVDTATLLIDGQRLQLAGLRSVDMPEAGAAARAYLAQAGNVKCDPAPVGGWRCTVLAKGLDVAEVFALSGFAKAAVNAPDFIRNAEGMARQNRRGVWGAS